MKERGRNEEKKGKSLGRNEGEAREEGGRRDRYMRVCPYLKCT